MIVGQQRQTDGKIGRLTEESTDRHWKRLIEKQWNWGGGETSMMGDSLS